MRSSIVRLAKQTSEKYLTPGNPTGITGILTHPAPRATLINIYNSTLTALKNLPADSAYRVSVEALTKHRLAILDGIKPVGHDDWLQRVKDKYPDLVAAAQKNNQIFAVDAVIGIDYDDRYVSWNGEDDADRSGATTDLGKYEEPKPGSELVRQEGSSYTEATRALKQAFEAEVNAPHPELEPALTADQVSEIEQKIGAGLIEEVIEVAKGELKLVDVLAENKVWEELEEREPEGQWSYFERSARHTAGDPR